MIDRAKLAENFSKSAGSYNSAATFQRRASLYLAEYLESAVSCSTDKPLSILEIGCGTGFITEKIMKRFPSADVTVSDISSGMLESCMNNMLYVSQSMNYRGNLNFRCESAFDILTGSCEQSYDLIVSGLTFQWLDNLEEIVALSYRALKQSGTLLFSTLGESTFAELRSIFRELEIPYPGPDFISSDTLCSVCSIFDSVDLSQKVYVEHYSDILNFLRHIQLTGAGNASNRTMSVPELRRVVRYSASEIAKSGVDAEYLLLVGLCKKCGVEI